MLMKEKKAINVIVIIFPDGSTHYFKKHKVFKNKPDKNLEYIRKCMKMWQECNKDKSKFHIFGALAYTRILENDYYQIPPVCDY